MDKQADDERLQALVDCVRKVPLVPALCRSASISRRWAALSVPTQARSLGSCKCFLDLRRTHSPKPCQSDQTTFRPWQSQVTSLGPVASFAKVFDAGVWPGTPPNLPECPPFFWFGSKLPDWLVWIEAPRNRFESNLPDWLAKPQERLVRIEIPGPRSG